MKIAAIIAEFNPLHWGHVHIIQEAKKQGFIVVVLMSGSFTQRGEPVVVDKFTRANDAIKAGADLVLTHPVTSATSHGEEFSSGAIEFLLELPYLQAIFCGGEVDNMNLLEKAIDIDNNFEKYQTKFHHYLRNGLSYTNSLKNTYLDLDPSLEEIFQPNMLLAFGYAKYLARANRLNMLRIIPRINKNEDTRFISASKIRSFDKISDYKILEKSCFNTVPQYNLSELMERLYYLYRFSFLSTPRNLRMYDGYEEGLENRIYEYLSTYSSMNLFLEKASTKRYAKVRLQRLILHYLLDINKEIIQDAKKNIHSFHVLAFNSIGQEYLKACKDSQVTLFTNFKTIKKLSKKEQFFHSLEENSSNLWSILTKQSFGLDYNKNQ